MIQISKIKVSVDPNPSTHRLTAYSVNTSHVYFPQAPITIPPEVRADMDSFLEFYGLSTKTDSKGDLWIHLPTDDAMAFKLMFGDWVDNSSRGVL